MFENNTLARAKTSTRSDVTSTHILALVKFVLQNLARLQHDQTSNHGVCCGNCWNDVSGHG